MSDVKVPPFTFLFDDASRKVASNGQLTRGALLAAQARALLHYQHRGRPIFHFWGYQYTNDNAQLFKFIRPNFVEGGGINFRGRFGVVPFNGDATSTQGVTVTVAGIPQDTPSSGPFAQALYPQNLLTVDTGDNRNVTGVVDENSFGPTDDASPYLLSGCLYEDFVDTADSDLTVTADGFKSGADILAVKTGAPSTVHRLQDVFRKTWRFQRPTAGWCLDDPDSLDNPAADPGIEFAQSPHNFRYLFDQRVGDGGGTAPSATGPGWTAPLMFSGAGRRTTIRCYVFVRACMTPLTGEGTPGEGRIGVANRDSSGTMATTFSELVNGPIVTGVTPAWYPDPVDFDPDDAPYFEAYCGSVPDRVLVGAKSTADATVRISAVQLVVLHRQD